MNGFELRRLAGQIDNTPIPFTLEEELGDWDFSSEEEDEESQVEDYEDETEELSSHLEDQADILDEISARILEISYFESPEGDSTDPVVLHVSRVISLLKETLELSLSDIASSLSLVERTVQNFTQGMIASDDEEVEGILEMANEAFQGEHERMEKMKDAVFSAIEDVEEALDGAEKDEVE